MGSPEVLQGQTPVDVALGQLRQRLIDTTGRNRLVNFKHTPGRSLQFVGSSLDAVFHRLTDDASAVVKLVPLPDPGRAEWVERNGRLARPDEREYATRLGIDPSFELAETSATGPAAADAGAEVRALLYADDLGKHGRKLERDARLAIQETGANMLYAVFGFLEFTDGPDVSRTCRAPLISIPVAMSRDSRDADSSFHLSYTGEELAENLALHDKVMKVHGLRLPAFDPDTQSSVEAHLRAVAAAIAHLPGWRVHRGLSLAMLSFANMLLLRDLDPGNWPSADGVSALLAHPLVGQIVDARSVGQARPGYAEEHDVDDHAKRDLPLVFDADSSQLSALIDVSDGKNLVIEGPPGTGKSQTIANVIAAALHAGQSVLFVSEKLAALQVVRTRLAQASLDPFVLELHAGKTSTKRVLEDVEARFGMRAMQPYALAELAQDLEHKRRELKAYAELMNSAASNRLELTLHRVLWRAERQRLRCADIAGIGALDVADAARVTDARRAELRDAVRDAARRFEAVGGFDATRPFWGYFPEQLTPGGERHVREIIQDFALRFSAFARAMAEAVQLVQDESVDLDARRSAELLPVLAGLAPKRSEEVDFGILPALFPATDVQGTRSRSILLDLRMRQKEWGDTQALLNRHVLSIGGMTGPVIQVIRDVQRDLQELALGGHTCVQLEMGRRALERRAAEARQALLGLQAIASDLGLGFAGSQADIDRLTVLYEALATSPLELVHLRTDAMRTPAALATLNQAYAKLRAIEARVSELDERLQMDALPAESALRGAILALRQGDAWHRIFQRRWRTAIRTHQALERTRRNKTPAQRRADLEAVFAQLAARRAWNNDATLRAVVGSHFREKDTPLKELIACAQWVRAAMGALKSAGLPTDAFDPVSIDRTVLGRIVAQAPALKAHLAALGELDKALRAFPKDPLPRFLRDYKSADWTVRLQIAGAVAGQVKRAEQIMTGRVRPESSANQGLNCLVAVERIPGMLQALDHHSDASALLGARYAGRNTNLAPLLAAHDFGVRVKRAALPPAIERVLLSDAGAVNLDHLTRCAATIARGWLDIKAFHRAMSSLGKFEPNLWAEPQGRPPARYVRELALKTRSAAVGLDGLQAWAEYVGARARAAKFGLSRFVEALERGVVPVDRAEEVFDFRFYASIAASAFDQSPVLRKFSGARHSAVRKEFVDLDKTLLGMGGHQIVKVRLANTRVPPGDQSALAAGKTELALLQHLFPQQRPRVPVRQLLKRAGHAIQALKPCFMLGPRAVARFLEPGHLKFDVVVMDEASQLRPEVAIGSIARGGQLVVVGDPRQLPPTDYFSTIGAADGDGGDDGVGPPASVDAESILDLCIRRFQPVRTLRSHYRSRHESLISFSNEAFYGGALNVFPSPFPKSGALGLRYHHLPNGVYDHQMNPIEAQRVVDAAVDHILKRPDDSLGIVTLNVKQRDLLSELLEVRLRRLPQADAFKARWEAEDAGIFVKNLENVQGDERDCILISMTFGKAPGSALVRQHFGPISRESGWRRLNVLFTRARKSVAVYSSLQPEDIVMDGQTPRGTQALRRYLEFARSGILPVERATGREPDSEFEAAVIDILKDNGYGIEPQLGVAGFRIDIAVKHPAHRSGYLAAIECDGATYHAGKSVRDRDRIRQEVLENLGWRDRIWHIWSTDWFRDPRSQTDMLLRFLEELARQPLSEEFVVEDAAAAPVAPPSAASAKPRVIFQSPNHFRRVPADAAAETPAGSGWGTIATNDLLVSDADAERVVEVGDTVAYTTPAAPEEVQELTISSGQTRLDERVLNENTAISQALLGAMAGETVVLRMPNRQPSTYFVKGIKRAAVKDVGALQ